MTQLKSHKKLLFCAGHHSPMAGHLGQDKTLIHAMAHFYLSGIPIEGMFTGSVWQVA